MSNYKRKEVFDYLTRKPVTARDIELARSRYQIPATSIEQPETNYQTEVQPNMVVPPQNVLPKGAEPVMPSVPGIPNPQFRQIELATGGRVNFQLGGGALARILGKKTITSEKEYSALKQFIMDTYSVNKDDPNLFPAIQKYSEKFGGNMSNTAESLGLNRKSMLQVAERRNIKLEGKGSSGTTKLKDLDYGDLSVSKLVDEVAKDPSYLRNLIKQNKINPNEFYNSRELAKILGVKEGKGYSDEIVTKFTRQKEKTYSKGSWTNDPVEIIDDPKRNQFKLYKLEDVLNNIEKYSTSKPTLSTEVGNKLVRKELDPELRNLLSNFGVKKNLILAQEGDDALREALIKNPKIGLEGNYYDYGHPFAIDHLDTFDFAKKNEDKIYSLSRSVIQDPYINQKILVGTQGQEKNLFSKIDKFLKENKGKTFDEETIAKAKAINQEADDLFNKRQSRIKEFINERSTTEPYLKGQENTLSNINIDIKPGKKISDTDITVFGDIDPRHSFGNIQNINPNANYFSDLTKEQKEMFKQNMIDQNINYSKNVLKQSKFDPNTIKDFEESMLFGPTDTKTGLIGETGLPNFKKGGRVHLKNGTDNGYFQEIPSLGLSDPIEILEQQMANEKDPIKVLALDYKLEQIKKKQTEEKKAAEEYKISQKEKGVRYMEDYPSQSDYFLETGKQLFTNPKYFYGKLGKGAVEGTEWLVGQPLQTLFSQEGKNFEFYQPVAGEKLGINKFIEENKPEFPTTGTLLAGDVAEIAGSIADPFLAYGLVKGAVKGVKPKPPTSTVEDIVDPMRRDILKTSAVMGTGAALYPIAKNINILEDLGKVVPKKAPLVKIIKPLGETATKFPEWFPSLVNRLRKEGNQKPIYATKEVPLTKKEYLKLREEKVPKIYDRYLGRTQDYIDELKQKNIPQYYQVKDTDDIIGYEYIDKKLPNVKAVEYDGKEMSVYFENNWGQTVEVNYTAPGVKSNTGDFYVTDARPEPGSGWESAPDFEPVVVNDIDEVLGGSGKVEQYATKSKKPKYTTGAKEFDDNELRALAEYDRMKDEGLLDE